MAGTRRDCCARIAWPWEAADGPDAASGVANSYKGTGHSFVTRAASYRGPGARQPSTRVGTKKDRAASRG